MKESIITTQWFEEARRGNRTCLNNLITFYHAQLLSYAMKICKFSNIAEDALQEAYINALVHFNEVKEPENFFFWLRTIVKRSCWQQMKFEKKTVPLSIKLVDSKISDNKIEDEIEKNNTNEFLWERISRLSESLRIVLLLRYFANCNNYDSISKILDIPVGTVRSRLNEGKKQLKKMWNLSLAEMPEDIKSEAEYWNEFYEYSFKFIQKDSAAKENFNNHLLPELLINFTSGKTAHGRKLIEKEFEDDLKVWNNLRNGFNI